ncbi:uncharacterized protein K02A2.6-like [Topomyia yanbarensis]|uniref:uncharacterized protein K02A2.6-like n=1 Tax=Topomyia yanbarensis TaxID=2498891 RepID=UPI00273AD5DC|nr:uncharacterized protein K02A2.6-like [Topomyia yanbarensis]
MRSIARQCVYWPNIDDEVAKIVRSCNECATVARCDQETNLKSWPALEKPWQRLHLDYAGPIDGQYYLILVDSYSKWPEVVRTRDITTTATLRILRGIFARHGQPETLVTDNGPQLTSDQFETFCDSNGITHLKTAPFHPQSNGLAERFVDTFKRSLKKITAGGKLWILQSTPFFSANVQRRVAMHPVGNLPQNIFLVDQCAHRQSYYVRQLHRIRSRILVKKNSSIGSTEPRNGTTTCKIWSGSKFIGTTSGAGNQEQ